VKQKRLLVIGLGNDILTDDGIGVRLIKDLTGMFENPLIEFKTACCGGLELMELILGFDRIILIDAIRTA
jgi:hydrogenase maturation protease